MNPSSFTSVPKETVTVNTETLTLDELKAGLVRKYREHGRSKGIARKMCEDTISNLEERIRKAEAVETINTCPECWLDTEAVRVFMGRELCPDCAEREESAFDEAQEAAWEEMDFGRHDQMSHIGSVLQGMGF